VCHAPRRGDIDANDAGKLLNPGENFMITRGNNIFLAVETRQQIMQSDTIFYAFKNLRPLKYQLRFMPVNLWEENLQATLVDNYLQKKISVNLIDNSFIDFMVDENNASYDNRFMLIFERTTKSLPTVVRTSDTKTDKIDFGLIKVYPNPVKDGTINIHYSKMPAGRYNLQLISQAGQIMYYSQLIINQPEGIRFIKLSKKTAAGNYQLLISDENGRKFLQQIIL
jgi:hypothetical protein